MRSKVDRVHRFDIVRFGQQSIRWQQVAWSILAWFVLFGISYWLIPFLMFDGFVLNDFDAVKVIEVFLVLISFCLWQSLKNNHKRLYNRPKLNISLMRVGTQEILGPQLQNSDIFIILIWRNLPFRFDNKLDGRSWKMKIFFLTLFSSEINWHQKNQIMKISCSHFSSHLALQTGLCEIAIGLEPVCCKKWQKIVPDQLLLWGIRALWRFWMVPNWS